MLRSNRFGRDNPVLTRRSYEFYYDAICGGQYIFRIREMHKKFVSIVSNPNTSIFFPHRYFITSGPYHPHQP